MEQKNEQNGKSPETKINNSEGIWRLICCLWVYFVFKEVPEHLQKFTNLSAGTSEVLTFLLIGILPVYLADQLMRPKLFRKIGVKTQDFIPILTFKDPKIYRLLLIGFALAALYSLYG